jgi:transposase
MAEHKSEDLKKVAVEYFLEHPEQTREDIADIFQTSVRSLLRWVEKYETMEGEIKRADRPAVAYKVNEEHIKYMLECVKDNKFITMKDLLALVKTKFPDLDISRYHLSRLLRQELITLKLKRHLHEPTSRFGKEVNIKSQIKEFYENVSKFKIEDIICLDETSISGLLKRNFCYSEKGKRCVHITNSQAVFKKYTGIFAISSSGIVAHDVYEKGGIDSDRLEKFVEEFIKKNNIKKKLDYNG